MSKVVSKTATLAGDFGLISVSDQLRWRNALAREVLKGLDLPSWKKEEQQEPVNATIACLVRQGMVSPAAIVRRISNISSDG
jgi:hypothetical protein